MGYEIADYRDEHEPAVAMLARALWRGDDAQNIAHLRWKYRETPLSEHGHLFVVLSGMHVVGVRGFVGGRWQMRDAHAVRPTAFTAVTTADLVIAPEHRGAGLGRRLIAAGLERVGAHGYPVAFSLSSSPALAASSMAAGFARAFSIEAGVRRVRPRAWRRAAARFGYCEAGLARLPCGDCPSALGRITAEPVAHAETMAELVERAPWDGRLRQVRDEAFFRWRFEGPRVTNRFLYYRDRGELRGYLVMQATHERPAVVRIVDFESDGDDVLAALVDAAAHWAQRLRIEVWMDPLSERIRHLLAGLGFDAVAATGVPAASGPPLLVRVLDEAAFAQLEDAGGRRVAERTDWDLRPVYSDAF